MQPIFSLITSQLTEDKLVSAILVHKNVQFNNNYDYGSLIGCFVGVTNITRTITAATWATSVSTYTTSVAHGFTVGQAVTVAGVTPAGYNGYYYIASVPTTTTFTVAQTVGPVGSGTAFGSAQVVAHPVGGTQINHNIFANPILYGIQVAVVALFLATVSMTMAMMALRLLPVVTTSRLIASTYRAT